MDAWPQRRGLQTMNLRSVFTAEQQRILERYYENGMTNQSKACFQLILQCAQEAKLDFSVVRTWVGNKRRKLASKVEQNGSASHSLSGHGLAGGLLSSPTLAGGVLSNHGLATGALLPPDMAAARNIQSRVHLLPPSSSFPALSSPSSSPSSASPLSSGSNNNNDVILTGIYSVNSVPRSRPRPSAPPTQPDSDLSIRTSSSLISQALQSRSTSTSSPVHSKLLTSSQTLPSLTASGPLVYTAIRKGTLSIGEGGICAGAGPVPHSWTRQYGTGQTRPWSSSSSQPQAQLQPRPHSNPQPTAPPKPRASLPAQSAGPSSEQTPRIQQVFTLSEKGDRERPRSGHAPAPRTQETYRPTPHPLDAGHYLSIAMETGNEEDEWLREEELANMAAQTHIHREQPLTSPAGADVSGVKRNPTPPVTGPRPVVHPSNASLQGSYALTVQTSLAGEASSQASLGVSAAPWVINSSRKRTLQDRTQFSDGDLVQLKRYWDRGMTSLGSVCREKIAAAANQLNVDTEIVKTWISNRRRKYRLMAIEIPPPKGGPAVFANSSPGSRSPAAASPDGERLRTPEFADDSNDGGSECISEDGTVDSHHRDGEEETDASAAAPLANNVKIEVIDEDEEADEDGDLMASDLEQMQNLLEFKHEEVQFLENELENQKQKYQELADFTNSLLSAVRDNDLARQKELLASLPQPSDQDWDAPAEKRAQSDPTPNHKTHMDASAQDSKRFLLVDVDKDHSSPEVTEPSASEELLQEAGAEQK
ncbi:highly divergent homeobox [Fundulus heteroclitus]|uniref:highly divergent homeobox n=1 Tax=Fundulus heteroclitus TaxID=8078 RepID=UPI00165ABF5D|nr:highly divergent homeobox [Fundulus heteroclitus]XP_035989262.1 highly divergent homeobox [Fundulus heteroclitus]XP_035989263.1 highly divergent homeobox [Fundulus heteroclitus]XP_035989264.1 highly divergent homeobox [Fundulus heteroclitus]XP_035989265.1 highly divergent homeobox [Fundulus heteroclitus]